MRLLFLTNLYPPHGKGGYEEWCQEVATQLRNRGHDVMVLTSQHGTVDDATDIAWVRRELHLEMELSSLRNGIQFFTARQQRAKENFETLRSYVRRFQPDAIMVWGMWNIVRSLPILAEKLLPGRVVYYMGDYWPTLPSQFEFYWKAPAQHWFTWLPKQVLGFFAELIMATEQLPRPAFEKVIFPTIFMRNELVKRGIRPRESVVIYGAADTAPYVQNRQMDHAHHRNWSTQDQAEINEVVREPVFADMTNHPMEKRAMEQRTVEKRAMDVGHPGGVATLVTTPDLSPTLAAQPATGVASVEGATPGAATVAANDKIQLVWAGRLRSDKGAHTAIKAVGRLVHEYGLTNVELLIAGDGEQDYLTFLHYLVRKQRLEQYVKFLGLQPKAAMPALYQRADIFLFTSVWQEPFGRVLVEAMASGTAVVGAKVGGAAEILVENENSLTFEPNDDQQLAAQLMRLIRTPELRTALSEQGCKVALEQFDILRMVQEIESYLGRVVKRASPEW